MFQRFTQEAKAVVVEAQDSAIELGSTYITPAHILYGCAEGRESTAGEPLRNAGITGGSVLCMLPRATENRESDIDHDALRAIGIEYDDVRHVVNETFGEGALESAPDRRGRPVTSRRPPFSTEAKHSLELSFRVALELHDKRIRPGHVLLGLLRLNDEFISRVIEQNEISVANLSAAVLLQLNA